MASEIVFEDERVREFIADIAGNYKKIVDRTPEVIGLLSSIVFSDVQKHFVSEQGPEAPWPDWSDRYKRFLASVGRSGNKKLQFSGNLRNNFLPTSVRKTGQGLLWFNNAKTPDGHPYAYAHNEGELGQKKREFMWLSDEGMERIEEQMVKLLES